MPVASDPFAKYDNYDPSAVGGNGSGGAAAARNIWDEKPSGFAGTQENIPGIGVTEKGARGGFGGAGGFGGNNWDNF